MTLTQNQSYDHVKLSKTFSFIIMLTYIQHSSQMVFVPPFCYPDSSECGVQTSFLLVSLPSHFPAANQIKNASANWNSWLYQVYKNIKGG